MREREREREGDRETPLCGPVWVSLSSYLTPSIASNGCAHPAPASNAVSQWGICSFPFCPLSSLLGKLFAISTISCTCRASQGEVFFGFFVGGVASPECRPCQVEYVSIVCRTYIFCQVSIVEYLFSLLFLCSSTTTLIFELSFLWLQKVFQVFLLH